MVLLWVVSVPTLVEVFGSSRLGNLTLRLDPHSVRTLGLDTLDIIPHTGRVGTPVPVVVTHRLSVLGVGSLRPPV